MRVFICSTCYDLIDLRAELEMFFREAGVDAILSESLSSEFQVMPDRNSIETCLANVRNCDVFLIILSNRYGPSLARAGFPDISATHLEYLEAVKCNKPIHMFVRDRLEADYNTWQKNRKLPDLELLWCKEPRDRKIFELLEEHRRLTSDGSNKNNWLWTFRDSTELKQRLIVDFKEAFVRVAIAKLASSGRIPFFEIKGLVEGQDRQYVNLVLFVRNLGTDVAVSPVLEIVGTQSKWNLTSLATHEQWMEKIHWANSGATIELSSRLSYSVLNGHKFVDEGKLTITYDYRNRIYDKVCYELKNRRYAGTNLEMLII